MFDGTVQDDGNTVKIRVHLDDPVRHATLWSGAVDGPAANSDQLQASIASTIVAVLACSNRALVPAHGLADPASPLPIPSRLRYFRTNGLDSRQEIYELLASLREVAAKAPDFAPTHSDFAKFALYYCGDLLPPEQAAPLRQEGEAEAHKALALDPKSPDGYLALSWLLPPTSWAGREKLLRQGVAGDPDWPHTNGFLGKLLAETGRLQDAAGYLQKAAAANLQIDWRPENAWLQCGSGQFEPATSYLSGALKLKPKDISTWGRLRTCLKFARRWPDMRALVDGASSRPASIAAEVRRTRRRLSDGRRNRQTGGCCQGPEPCDRRTERLKFGNIECHRGTVYPRLGRRRVRRGEPIHARRGDGGRLCIPFLPPDRAPAEAIRASCNWPCALVWSITGAAAAIGQTSAPIRLCLTIAGRKQICSSPPNDGLSEGDDARPLE